MPVSAKAMLEQAQRLAARKKLASSPRGKTEAETVVQLIPEGSMDSAAEPEITSHSLRIDEPALTAAAGVTTDMALREREDGDIQSESRPAATRSRGQARIEKFLVKLQTPRGCHTARSEKDQTPRKQESRS